MRFNSMISGATVVALAGILAAGVALGQDWPVKRNKDYRPAAASAATSASTSFDSFNTGVVIKFLSANIASDGTITTRFTLQDSGGAGLDNTGVLTAGPVSMSFVAATIPNGQTQYTAYTTTVDKSITNNNAPQTQAGGDTGGKYTLIDAASGTYDYTFGTKAPAGFDVTATHTIGAQASRNLATYGYPTAFTANTTFDFVPNGSKVTNVRDLINEASCNGCHNPISAHGGARTEIAYCVLCHQPQSTNPDSLNTVDFKVFVHKIHMGSSLPSVIAGTPYQVVHRGAVVDFSKITFPQDIRNCTKCHASGPTQADSWKTQPSRAACGSCHDDVNFATGKNHPIVQVDDTQCSQCHTASAHTEFDASIPGAHTIPNNSAQLPGVVLSILNVANTAPGNNPTVSFSVMDKSGNPIDITKLTTIRMVLGGNNVDYGANGGIRVSETPTKATPG